MQLKFIALSAAALVASAYASPAADVTIPVTDLPIIESVLPSSAKAYILSHGEKSFSQKIASEFEAGKTPSWFTKLPPSIETLLAPQNATVRSNSTTMHGHGNMTTTKSHGGNGGGSGNHHSTPIITTGPGPVSITKTSANGGKTSSASSSTSSTSNGAAVASAVFGAGFAGAVGLMGVLAL